MKKNLYWLHSMRPFLILWSSQAISTLGSAMTSFALIIWVYDHEGTATSIALLSFFSFLPSVLFAFVAGALADRWNKKRIMLISDLVAAMGTVTVFVLYGTDQLQIWHLYLVNLVISFMNAFQSPAAYVATSLLVPEDQYVRAGGLQSLSDSLVAILTPALAAAILAFGGLKTVLIVDLSTFAVAFSTLLFFIHLPPVTRQADPAERTFLQSCTEGLRFLMENRGLLHLILYFFVINLLAYFGSYGPMLPAMVLSRTGGDQAALGVVTSAVGIGTLAGSVLVTLVKPARNRLRVAFVACAISFVLCDPLMGIGRTVPVWILAALAGNLPLPFVGANLTTVMRTNVPLEMQGRVLSTRNTLQFAAIPASLLLAGVLADHVFEPFMGTASPLQGLCASLVGTGKGSGIALMILLCGLVGGAFSLLGLQRSGVQSTQGIAPTVSCLPRGLPWRCALWLQASSRPDDDVARPTAV